MLETYVIAQGSASILPSMGLRISSSKYMSSSRILATDTTVPVALIRLRRIMSRNKGRFDRRVIMLDTSSRYPYGCTGPPLAIAHMTDPLGYVVRPEIYILASIEAPVLALIIVS